MDPRFQRLIELLKAMIDREKQIHDLNVEFQKAVAAAKELETLRKIALSFSTRLDGLIGEEQKALDEALSLAQQLSEEKQPPVSGTVRAGDVANQFRTLIDTIQGDARKSRPGEMASTLKSLDIELKGLIVIEDNEAKIVPPTPDHPVDPGQLSTIKMSFGSVPVLRSTEEKPS